MTEKQTYLTDLDFLRLISVLRDNRLDRREDVGAMEKPALPFEVEWLDEVDLAGIGSLPVSDPPPRRSAEKRQQR